MAADISCPYKARGWRRLVHLRLNGAAPPRAVSYRASCDVVGSCSLGRRGRRDRLERLFAFLGRGVGRDYRGRDCHAAGAMAGRLPVD